MKFQERKIQKLLEEIEELNDYFKNSPDIEFLKKSSKESLSLIDNFLKTITALGKFEGEGEKLHNKLLQDLAIIEENSKEQREQFEACCKKARRSYAKI